MMVKVDEALKEMRRLADWIEETSQTEESLCPPEVMDAGAWLRQAADAIAWQRAERSIYTNWAMWLVEPKDAERTERTMKDYDSQLSAKLAGKENDMPDLYICERAEKCDKLNSDGKRCRHAYPHTLDSACQAWCCAKIPFGAKCRKLAAKLGGKGE